MSAIPESTPEPAPLPALGRFDAGWRRFDAWNAWASDYLNPILVKETRQALKSRQFMITFSLLLLCGWLWSMMVLAWGPEVQFGGSGADIFAGYFCILCFPLLIVIPFGAYRSLAAEWEDGTYDLMSISTLTARQIVTGKLGSAVLQMIVYLSAIAPCVAFTYLLRGVDVLTINYLLFWLCLNSLTLTFFALALATLTRQRLWQVFVSVVLVLGCAMNFIGGIAFVMEEVLYRQFFQFDQGWFWITTAAMLNVAVGYCALFLLIARARLMFPTENRSTALRVTMLAHYGMFAGWMGWGWVFPGEYFPFVGMPFMVVVAIHWHVMGMFMTSEGAELSPRVKRGLPQSFLGRVFLTWFNPGSGTGYVFAAANVLAAALLAGGALYWVHGVPTGTFPQGTIVASPQPWNARWLAGSYNIILLTPCYVVVYLGLGRLLIRFIRRWGEVNLFMGVVFHLGLLAAANLAPLFLQFGIGMLEGVGIYDYTIIQYPAPFWSLGEAADGRDLAYFESPLTYLGRQIENIVALRWMVEMPPLTVVLPLAAMFVFALNLPSVAREIQQLRVAKPRRVEEDDLELNPPPAPQPTSPWG